MDKLESIINTSTAQCDISAIQNSSNPSEISANKSDTNPETTPSTYDGDLASKGEHESQSLVDRLTEEIKALQGQISLLLSNSNGTPQPQQLPQLQPQLQPQSSSSTSDEASTQTNLIQVDRPSDDKTNTGDGKSSEPINSGFLEGLPTSPPPGGEALIQLNQSQKVDTSEMQSVLELTIPNVVSNIFSNIQNVTIETEHHQDGGSDSGDESGKLTSIDGSSIDVSGNSTEQITAQGEQLFVVWINHQLQSLHLTASVAAYIERSAINLFRRIVRQYVERVEKVGGRVEENVIQATQIALNNTQNLIAFLLKNYLNFAAGLMQIIGEQVSRVGKQLDATGETIAHINLNPFDIVSNVIGSLPNPSRYSEYFRAFGKYLMGEPSMSNSNSEQQQQPSSSQANGSSDDQEMPKSIFSKTMSAIGKTLGSWIG